jgi:glycosyltransferase involved in cell wall biosynthesis
MAALSLLSAFGGFGMEKSHLVRPSLARQVYEIPAFLLSASPSWLLLADGAGSETDSGTTLARICRRTQADLLLPMGLWCGSAGETLDELWTDTSSLFVDAEFLADLADPRPLLLAIKRRCLSTGETVLFSAPRRGAPQWCWSAKEFKALLALCGFVLTDQDGTADRRFLSATLSEESYRLHLGKLGIRDSLSGSTQLLVTSEDATIVPTGGIGTYTKMRKSLDPMLPVLYCNFEVGRRPSDSRTFWPEDLLGSICKESFIEGLGLVEAVRVLLMLLPNLRLVEFQDYQSLGFRLVQSKATAGLPSDLTLRVLLHGGVDYVKHGIQDDAAANYSLLEAALAARDAFIYANVDEAVSPSRYLGRLLEEEFGYAVRNLRTAPLPFVFDGPETVAHYGPIRRIAFLGKYNTLKGWPDFLKAIRALAEHDQLHGIKEICSIAPGVPPEADAAQLARIASYVPLHLNHEQFLTRLVEYVPDTLFVIPSRGENYPYLALEQVLLGTRFVAYGSGGLPEVIGEADYVEQFCCAPNAADLAERMGQVLRMQADDHGRIAHDLKCRARARQDDINKAWSALPSAEVGLGPVLEGPDVSVVVPFYNTPIRYIEELLASIEGSTLRPSEVIFVDDGSGASAARDLADLIAATGSALRLRVAQQSNGGLAAARNRGLAESRSAFTFLIDSDDLLLPSTLQDCWAAMMRDPQLLVCTGFGLYFSDAASLPDTPKLQRQGVFWKPLGIPEARSVSLFQNNYMAANAMVRTEGLRRSGGWDDTDWSMWEDWALFNRLAWSGKRFLLLPAPGFLYRNTPGSMSKTYSRYFARRRLVRSLPMMSRLDANTVMSLVANGGGSAAAVLPLTSYEAELLSLMRRALARPKLRRMAAWTYRRLSALRRRILMLRSLR